MGYRFLPIVPSAILVLLAIPLVAIALPRSVTVRVKRQLAVQQLNGTVLYQKGAMSRPAKVGDLLQVVGDGITTGSGAASVLSVDTAIGFITVSENTQLKIRSLEYAADNGRITRLQITKGQVRLRLRRFTHPGSLLELQTPSGVSGVRGTEFGMNVQEDGKSGLATLTGSVATSARGRTVLVPAGFQNFTIPGEPPSPPVPLRNDPGLRYQIERMIEGNIRQVRLLGQVDPVNSVLVDDRPQEIDRVGRFNVLRLVPSRLKIRVTVTTPLGKKQVHELEIR